MQGEQSATFAPAEDGGTRVDLRVDYELSKGGPFQALSDALFIRRALRDALKRTLRRYTVEAAEEAESQPAELRGEADHVDLVPGLGDLIALDSKHRGRGERDGPAGGRVAHEGPVVGPGPALVGGHQVVLAEDQQDLVLQVGEAVEEGLDRPALARRGRAPRRCGRSPR